MEEQRQRPVELAKWRFLPAARDAYLRVQALLLEQPWTPELAVRCHEELAGILDRRGEVYPRFQLYSVYCYFDSLVDTGYPTLGSRERLVALFSKY